MAIMHDMQSKSGVHFRRTRARIPLEQFRVSYVMTEITDARKPREIASVRTSGSETRAGCCTCWHATVLRSCSVSPIAIEKPTHEREWIHVIVR